VTICTHEKACIFGSPERQNPLGNIAVRGLLEVQSHFSDIKIDKFVVMPNHVHAIVVLQGNDVKLPVVIGQYKSYVSREIHKLQPGIPVWQTSFHDHVVRNQADYERIWAYIDTNPARWMDDCFYIP
jgi:REP element-mobilizing transposase RayT